MGLVDNLTPSSCADGELSFSLLHWWWSGVCWSPLFHQQFQEKVLFRLCFIRGLRCMVLSGSKLWNICDCLWSTWRSLFLWRSPSLPWSTRCRSLLWCGYCLERSGPLAIGRSTCFGFNCGKSTWSDCRSLLCLQVSSQPLLQKVRRLSGECHWCVDLFGARWERPWSLFLRQEFLEAKQVQLASSSSSGHHIRFWCCRRSVKWSDLLKYTKLCS